METFFNLTMALSNTQTPLYAPTLHKQFNITSRKIHVSQLLFAAPRQLLHHQKALPYSHTTLTDKATELGEHVVEH